RKSANAEERKGFATDAEEKDWRASAPKNKGTPFSSHAKRETLSSASFASSAFALLSRAHELEIAHEHRHLHREPPGRERACGGACRCRRRERPCLSQQLQPWHLSGRGAAARGAAAQRLQQMGGVRAGGPVRVPSLFATACAHAGGRGNRTCGLDAVRLRRQ